MKFGRLACALLNRHAFERFSDGFKRRCVHCAREEWLMSRPYPRSGQVALYWMDVQADERGRRARARQSPR